MTRDQHDAWMRLAERRDAAKAEIERSKESLLTETDPRTRETDQAILEHETEFLNRSLAKIGIWPNRDPMARHRHKREMEQKANGKKRPKT